MTTPPNYQWQQFLERTFPAYPPIEDERRKDVELKDMEEGSGAAGQHRSEASSHQARAQPRFSLRNTMTKWFVDCITMGALLNTVAFFVLMGILKGQDFSKIWNNIKTVSILAFSCPATKYYAVHFELTAPRKLSL